MTANQSNLSVCKKVRKSTSKGGAWKEEEFDKSAYLGKLLSSAVSMKVRKRRVYCRSMLERFGKLYSDPHPLNLELEQKDCVCVNPAPV